MSIRFLPMELWTKIFEAAINHNTAYVDVYALRQAYERNTTLTACALVRKDWAAPAQALLFRDISLGVIVDPANSSVVGDAYELERPLRPGHTDSTLKSLISTLEAFHISGSAIPSAVRALHLCVGHTEVDRPRAARHNSDTMDHIVHGSPADVARAISLCTGLVHLSFFIGAFERGHLDFSDANLALLRSAHLPHLRHLSVDSYNYQGWQFDFSGYSNPDVTPAHQLIATFAHQLTILDVKFNRDCHLDDGDPLPPLPRLRTLRIDGETENIREAVSATAAQLEHIVVTWPSLPPEVYTIRELTLDFLWRGDHSIFRCLEILNVAGNNGSATDADLHVLGSLPTSLRRLSLPAGLVQLAFERTAEYLRRLPRLESLTLIRPAWYVDVFDPPRLVWVGVFEVPRVFHVPVFVAPSVGLCHALLYTRKAHCQAALACP